MQKNTLRLLLGAVGLWAAAELGHQAYVAHTNRIRGRFYWPAYACERNRGAIRHLYALAAQNRTRRAFLEVRAGELADSTGHLPGPARALLRQLAHDLSPTGSLYLAVDPVRSRHSPLVVTGACPTTADCHCLESLHPAAVGGVLFVLSRSSASRGHTSTDFEYVRASNPSLHAWLQQSPCYRPTGRGDFLRAGERPASFPVPYNEDHTDWLATTPLRALGLL